MDFEVVTINDNRLLPVRLASQILDLAFCWVSILKCRASSADKARCNTASLAGDPADGLHFTLPPNASLLNSLLSNGRETFSASRSDAGTVDQLVPPELGFLSPPAEEPLPFRLVHAVRSSVAQELLPRPTRIAVGSPRTSGGAGEGDYSDLPFLNGKAAASFPRRLGKEALSFVSALARDPKGYWSSADTVTTAAKTRQRKIRAVVLAAGTAYVVLLAAAYISHRSSGRVPPGPKQQSRDHVVLLAALPAIAKPAALPRVESPAARPRELSQRKPVSSPEPARTSTLQPTRPNEIVTNAELKPETIAARAPASGSGSPLPGDGNGGGAAAGSQGLRSGPVAGTNTQPNYDEVFSVSSVSSRPRILSRPLPGYTDDARRSQIEGSVKVSVVLRSDGTVAEATVVKGLGHGLDEKALEAARQLQFIPAEKDGHKVSVRVFLDFKFSLL